jgi:hypothetical protein
MEKVLRNPPVPPLTLNPELPPGFVAFLDWSLQKSPRDRPTDAATFVRELEAIAASPEDASRIFNRIDPTRRPRRLRIMVLLALAALAMACGVLWLALRG